MRLLRDITRRGAAAVVVTHERAARVVGRPGRVPARRAARRSDGEAGRPGVVARTAAGARVRQEVKPGAGLVRWAWRMFRKEWRQQLLVLGLLTVAVAAAVAGTAPASTAGRSTGDGGRPRTGPHRQLRPGSRRRPGRRGPSALRRARGDPPPAVPVPGSTELLDVRGQDPTARSGTRCSPCATGATRWPPARSRSPKAPPICSTRGWVGRWSPAALSGLVVGRVENPADLDDEFALLAPSSAARPTRWSSCSCSPRPRADAVPDARRPRA